MLYEEYKSRAKAGRGANGKLTPIEAAVGGALSAATAQALATPLDVARVRIMTADDAGRAAPPGGALGTIRAIAADEGVGALYAGVAPKVARALASGAIQFSTYEATKAWAVGFIGWRFPGSERSRPARRYSVPPNGPASRDARARRSSMAAVSERRRAAVSERVADRRNNFHRVVG